MTDVFEGITVVLDNKEIIKEFNNYIIFEEVENVPLSKLVLDEDKEKLMMFLLYLKTKKLDKTWFINIQAGGVAQTLEFIGFYDGEHYILCGARSRYEILLCLAQSINDTHRYSIHYKELMHLTLKVFKRDVSDTLLYDDLSKALGELTTIQRQLVNANRESKIEQEKYKATLAIISESIVNVDENGTIFYANKSFCDLVEQPIENIIDKHYNAFLIFLDEEEKILDLNTQNLSKTKSEKITQVKYLQIYDKDGIIPIELSMSRIEYSNKKMYTLTIRDISPQLQLLNTQKQLTELSQLINKIIRHDITNAMVVIDYVFSNYLQEKEEPDIQIAFRAIEKISKILDNMAHLEALIFSKEDLIPFNVRETVESVIKDINVPVEIIGNGVVMADYALYSIFDNIIRNAIIHGATPKITVTIEERFKNYIIKISDYGKGIPEEIKEKIFLQGITHGKNAGTGLGLFIVESIVKRYGGKITITDNKPKGAIFEIQLKKGKEIEY